ncbi:MAG: HlyD family efflux transporter periplasmic adaptor subunit [Phycisphaerae bacterium]|nr:HlyD family efflux transporter periplasmic adaptor subunit [Phycisphaerae bacterium]
MGLRSFLLLILQLLLSFLLGCQRDTPPRASGAQAESQTAPSNRVAVPEAVRRNLGITFAKVESRRVAQTIRVPGQFELLPEARREYRTMLAGRVELLVKQYDVVEVGTPLYRLASPEWRDLQARLTEAESAIRQTEARVASIPMLIAAHRRHEEILEQNIAMWESRVATLAESGSSGVVTVEERTSAQDTLAAQRAALAEILEKEADLAGQIVSAQAQHDAEHARFRLLISTASSVLGIAESALAAPSELEEHFDAGIHKHEAPSSRPLAAWRKINEIEVRAQASGVIQSLDLTNGAWATTGSLVLVTIQPDRLRFHAKALQSDLGRLRDGLPARVVPPKGGSVKLQDTMDASLSVGLTADPQERTVELVAVPSTLSPWARSGVSAHLEVITAGGQNELAIPLSSVIQDGLARIVFRRDPRDPDKVIRLDADLGIDDGRWVVIHSGVKEGDEVVAGGNYQLMLATSGNAAKGGHFHPDGTFHDGEDK